MNNWLELARIFSPAILAVAGVILAGLRTYDRYLHRKALMVATDAQRAALEKMPVPSPLYDRGGTLLLLLAVGLAVFDLPRQASDQAERALGHRLQYAKHWSCADCQEIGDFQADLRRRGLPIYRVSDDVQER